MNYEKLKKELESSKGSPPNPEFLKKIMGGLPKESDLKEQLDSLTGMASNVMGPLKKQLEVLLVPKRKKNAVFNGRQYVIEQLTDGRCILIFPTIEDSDMFYEENKLD